MSITCEEMKLMDSHAINKIKIPSILLMERASLEVIDNIDLDKNNSFTIVSGVGNNGGDGLAIARHLILKDKKVDLFIVGDMDKASLDFNINLKILENLDHPFTNINKDNISRLKSSLQNSHMTIDSIFGIGLTRNIEGLFLETIKSINSFSNYVLSIDVPSGIDGDTGDTLGMSVKSDLTITFHKMKVGLDKNKKIGKVIVADIGIPDKSTKAILNK